MSQKFTWLACLLALCFSSNAQSKVFKEVGEEISSKMKAIIQDNSLVGYLSFTRLEKASEDSFNYRISIMDENLNDLGKVNFREENLDLQAVSFEQDVLCLAYFKSKNVPKIKNNGKLSKRTTRENSVIAQFIDLKGNLLKTQRYAVELSATEGYYMPILKHSINLRNIPQKGFACFFGDDNENLLMAYNLEGKQEWKKTVPHGEAFVLLSSQQELYLLTKQKMEMKEGGFSVTGYNALNGDMHDRIDLRDKQGNSLKVISFENDPVTGKPIIAGNIIDKDHGIRYSTPKNITKGAYAGVFTIALNGTTKKDVAQTFSYGNDGSLSPAIGKEAKFEDINAYARQTEAMRDFNGNTYFVGSTIEKKPRIGAIVASVVLSPTLIMPPLLLGGGTNKFRVRDAMVLKQDASGKLSESHLIPCDLGKSMFKIIPLEMVDLKTYYSITNGNNKTNFVIVDDIKNIIIYNLSEGKVIRTVAHKDGNVRTNIFPAKEGHMMVAEYNKKEKTTRLSIEAL